MGIFERGSVLMGCVVGEYAPVGECLGEGVGVGVVDDGECLQVLVADGQRSAGVALALVLDGRCVAGQRPGESGGQCRDALQVDGEFPVGVVRFGCGFGG